MADKLAVWKQACVHLGKARVTSLTEDTATRYAFDDAWPGVVEEAFNQGDWNFAKKTAQLVASVSGTATGGYSYVYDYPSDWMRTLAVSPLAEFRAPFTDYIDEGGFLHSSTSPLYIRYIRDDLVDDADVSTWPTMFWRFVALKLAYESCERLTQSTTLSEKLEKLMDRALKKARSVDARNEQGKRIYSGSWLAARGGYGVGSPTINIQGTSEIALGEGDV